MNYEVISGSMILSTGFVAATSPRPAQSEQQVYLRHLKTRPSEAQFDFAGWSPGSGRDADGEQNRALG